MNVSQVLSELRRATGWTQAVLAERLGADQSDVSRWLQGRQPSGRNIEAIRALAIEYRVIVPSDDAARQRIVPIMGRVGAGGEIDVEHEQPPPEGFDQVELPFSLPHDMIGFEVDGDSMYPEYDPGEVIVCFREQRRVTEAYVGRKAVVRTDEGMRYLKRIARGPARGTYNLESWNARTIEGVRIEWVGEIVASINSAVVRRPPATTIVRR